MHFGSALDLSDKDFWDIDLLDTDIPGKHFVCLQDFLKIFRLPRRLKYIFNTSSRRLERRKTVTLRTCWRRLQDMSWRRLQDVLKITNVSWDILLSLMYNLKCILCFQHIFQTAILQKNFLIVINKIIHCRPVVVNVAVTDVGAIVILGKVWNTVVFVIVGDGVLIGLYGRHLRKKPVHLYIIIQFLNWTPTSLLSDIRSGATAFSQ